MFKPNLRTTLLGSGAAVAMMAASVPAAAGEIDDLKAQIDSLQNKLDSIEARQDAVETRGPVAPAAAVEAGDKPKTWKLPGTNTSMNIGGYAKLDLIYDLNNFLGDSLGLGGVALNGTTNDRRNGIFRAHARQSRFWVKTWTPTDWGELATHVEADFEGGGGNEVISNSSGLRARHLYGRLGPVLAGQTWTNFMDVSALPETIDFGGPVASFIRQAQLRYTHAFGGSGLTLALAIENPETVAAGAGGTAGPGLVGTAPTGPEIDKLPDFTAQLRYKHSRGHVALRGMLQKATVESAISTNNGALPTNAGGSAGAAFSDSELGWGLAVSGTYVLGSKDAFGAEFNYGDGIGRYLLISAGQGFSCTNNNATGSVNAGCAAATGLGEPELESQVAWGGFAWWQHKWTDTIRTNAVFGYGQVETDNLRQGPAASFGFLEEALSVHGNIIWSPVSQVNFGLEFIYLHNDRNINGDNAAARFQIGMQYKF